LFSGSIFLPPANNIRYFYNPMEINFLDQVKEGKTAAGYNSKNYGD
jgi:hypothetical protein